MQGTILLSTDGILWLLKAFLEKNVVWGNKNTRSEFKESETNDIAVLFLLTNKQTNHFLLLCTPRLSDQGDSGQKRLISINYSISVFICIVFGCWREGGSFQEAGLSATGKGGCFLSSDLRKHFRAKRQDGKYLQRSKKDLECKSQCDPPHRYSSLQWVSTGRWFQWVHTNKQQWTISFKSIKTNLISNPVTLYNSKL